MDAWYSPKALNESMDTPPLRFLAYANVLPAAVVCTWMFARFTKISTTAVTIVSVLLHALIRSLMLHDYMDKLVAVVDVVLFHLLASVILPCILIILSTRLVRMLYEKVCMPEYIYNYFPLLLALFLLSIFWESFDIISNKMLNSSVRPIYFNLK